MFDKESFQWFLSKSITLYCKSVLPTSSFRVDVMIGITVNDADVATLLCFSESIVKSSDGESTSQDGDSQNTVNGALKHENDVASDEHGGENFYVASGNRPNPGTKIEPADHAIPNELNRIRFHQKVWNCGSGSKKCDEMESGIKREVGEDLVDENCSAVVDDGEDCYVNEETEETNTDMTYGSYNQENWTNDEWNDSTNYEQGGMNSEFVNKSDKYQRPGQKHKIQRVALNYGDPYRQTPQGTLPPSFEYNNLMQDICTSMVNQSTAFSKKTRGINGALSSSSPVTCHICHTTLSNTLCLRNHIQGTHLALKLKRCNICGETFKWPMQLARHKKRVHEGGAYLSIFT